MSNRFFVSLLVVIAIIIGAFAFTKHNSNKPTSNNTQPTVHTEGSGKTGVTLIEYGDYQCPACYSYEPLVQSVRQKYKDQITFQFRNFPITSKHPNAFAAARAAEAAAKQGKFWEMHDLLYQHSHTRGAQGLAETEWASAANPSTYFENYAKQLGLNVDQFRADFSSQAVNDLVNADLAEAAKVPVNATPTFVLDGKKIEQSIGSIEDFNKIIDQEISKKTTANQ